MRMRVAFRCAVPSQLKLCFQDRLVHCLHMLERFDVKALRKVIKKLPEYKGRRKGEQDDVLDDVMSHLDDMAAKKADIVAEAAMITKIKDKLEKA